MPTGATKLAGHSSQQSEAARRGTRDGEVTMVQRLAIAMSCSLAGIAAIAGIGLALSAPAQADPFCDANSPSFNQDACALEPQNDASCRVWAPSYNPTKCLSDQFTLGIDENEASGGNAPAATNNNGR